MAGKTNEAVNNTGAETSIGATKEGIKNVAGGVSQAISEDFQKAEKDTTLAISLLNEWEESGTLSGPDKEFLYQYLNKYNNKYLPDLPQTKINQFFQWLADSDDIKEPETLGESMKPIYEKAIELFKDNSYVNQTRFYFDGKNLRNVDLLKEQDKKRINELQKQEFKYYPETIVSPKEDDFEFVLVNFDQGGDIGVQGAKKHIKIMKKPIKFTFTLYKDDPEDLNRMQFVYDVTVACKGNELLLPLAKKVMPDWQKIEKKFPQKKDLKNEYKSLDIHDKSAVVNFIKNLLG